MSIFEVPVEEELMRLLKFANIKRIRDYVAKNPSINLHHCTFELKTPLLEAIHREDPQILAFLIDKVPTCIDDTTTQPYGRTALMYAAFVSKNSDILQVLLKKGADPLKVDIRGWNCLYYALVGNQLKNVDFLLDAGLCINSRDFDGRTPLMIAVILSNLDILTLLLDRGADVAIFDKRDCTALQLAILRKKRDATIALIKKSNDLSLPKLSEIYD